MNLADDREGDTLGGLGAEVHAHRPEEPRVKPAYCCANLMSDSFPACSGTEESDVVRAGRCSEFPEVRDIGGQVMTHDDDGVAVT